MRVDLPIVGPSYVDEVAPFAIQQTINWVPEIAEVQGARTVTALKDPPGIDTFATITGDMRAALINPLDKKQYVVVERSTGLMRLYSITSAGVATDLTGNFSGDGEVMIETDGNYIVIVCGAYPSKTYVYGPITPPSGGGVLPWASYFTYDSGAWVSYDIVGSEWDASTPYTAGQIVYVLIASTSLYSLYQFYEAIGSTTGDDPRSSPGDWAYISESQQPGICRVAYQAQNDGLTGTPPYDNVSDWGPPVAQWRAAVPAYVDGTYVWSAGSGQMQVYISLIDSFGGMVPPEQAPTVWQAQVPGAPITSFLNIDSLMPWTASSVSFADGYFIFTRESSGQFCITALNNPYVFDGLDIASAEGFPDNIVRGFVDHRQLFLFGVQSIEVWNNTGNADFPYERDNGAVIERGLGAKRSVSKFDNGIVWLAEDGIVYRWTGGAPARISTYPIEQDISKTLNGNGDLTFANAYAFSYRYRGHWFYVLNLRGFEGGANSKCWAYDATTQQWTRRASSSLAYWNFSMGVEGFGDDAGSIKNTFLYNLSSGKVFKLNPNISTEDGLPIVRERVTAYSQADMRNVFGLQIELLMNCGQTPGTANVELRYSDDFGATWSAWKSRPLGTTGQVNRRIKFSRMGKFRTRVFHIRVISAQKADLLGAFAAATVGTAIGVTE